MLGRILERETGLEPATSSLEGWCSSQLSYSRSISSRQLFLVFYLRAIIYGGGRIRTSEGLRRQIYSLLPLATWVPLQLLANVDKNIWSWRWDSNPQPADYKSAALPIELRQLNPKKKFIYHIFFECNPFFSKKLNFLQGGTGCHFFAENGMVDNQECYPARTSAGTP